MSARIFIVVLVQTLVLAGMAAQRQWTLSTGTPVILETRPVDPRSLFSGDYVNLNYAIADLRMDELAGDREFKRHDEIQVGLRQDGEYWKAVSVHHRRPPAADGLFIKGRVDYAADQIWDQRQNKLVEGRHLRVRYGVEDYFVQEGTGRELERPRPGEKVAIQVAVDRFGNAGIKAILVDGRPRHVETLF